MRPLFFQMSASSCHLSFNRIVCFQVARASKQKAEQLHFLQGYAETFPLVAKIKMFDASSMLIPGGTSI